MLHPPACSLRPSFSGFALRESSSSSSSSNSNSNSSSNSNGNSNGNGNSSSSAVFASDVKFLAG